MEETYTFSRALYLMRYGGKKMRCVNWKDETLFCYVQNNDLELVYKDLVGVLHSPSIFMSLEGSEIMGSWVEVKD